ncbi:MAG TPA: dTDP-4-dehydrorhamnose 3,5-epimerase family protein [Pyrinomonadaceae bacterium]|jgi:dTDP-4-dehydrorhamnose 3,5-epimerase
MSPLPGQQQQQQSELFIRGAIRDVLVRPLRKFYDERGWLAELFRHDQLTEEFHPAMAYISATLPGVTRGPHEHADQADFFCFIGPSNFELRMWDNREASATYRHVMTLTVGEDNPQAVLVPKGVVHAYRNIGPVPGIVINCPNRLYMGEGRRESVDEIRHEDDPETIFRMD